MATKEKQLKDIVTELGLAALKYADGDPAMAAGVLISAYVAMCAYQGVPKALAARIARDGVLDHPDMMDIPTDSTQH